MLINIRFGFMMFVVFLVEFSKGVQNEISAKGGGGEPLPRITSQRASATVHR
jgi:hypothetical protein